MRDFKETLKQTIQNLPADWLRLTTHRLDIYNEKLAKVEFLEKYASLSEVTEETLKELPTAFDYIRLGHPLSCVLEWGIAQEFDIPADHVISFSSQAMPILAVLRNNQSSKKKTRILTEGALPPNFDQQILKEVYGYDVECLEVNDFGQVPSFDGSTIVINGSSQVDAEFFVDLYPGQGSVIRVMSGASDFIKEIQHVRRRESIAMTPQNCLDVLGARMGEPQESVTPISSAPLMKTIHEITKTKAPVALGSCGLSVQYAIMMGLIDHANINQPGKRIHFIVPPNCYGGTNDQARRVAACIDNVEVVDFPVDGGKDMIQELGRVLEESAKADAVPYVIAEIPTNPRVEVPDLEKLRTLLKKQRENNQGQVATSPVFVLDQTFCPNVQFFGENGYLNDVKAISYVSGSKFPSGGLCTAGYCVANESAAEFQDFVIKHLDICDNGATDFQVQTLTEQMPTMNQRIAGAYKNTRGFVDFIQKSLPEAKINFVSHELAKATFTPSVFSLDLPSRGNTPDEKEENKRQLNHRLIRMMIDAIPDESKHCVSYGQLKGCYWTIPATSTQGTTKESDKDYIVRVSVAADFDLEKHKEVFKDFCSALQ